MIPTSTFRSPPTATVAVITVVADATGRDPTDLPPLYEHVDPEALNSLFDAPQASGDGELTVEFVYEGHLVTVTTDKGLTVTVDE